MFEFLTFWVYVKQLVPRRSYGGAAHVVRRLIEDGLQILGHVEGNLSLFGVIDSHSQVVVHGSTMNGDRGFLSVPLV